DARAAGTRLLAHTRIVHVSYALMEREGGTEAAGFGRCASRRWHSNQSDGRQKRSAVIIAEPLREGWVPQCPGRCLGSILDLNFAKYGLHVNLHGGLGDHQPTSDELVRCQGATHRILAQDTAHPN